jgi:CRP-like cAMP-binding protein
MAKTHPLGEVKLFAGLDDAQLDAVSRVGETKQFEVGDVIFAEGDTGTHLYCLLSGRVEITLALEGQTEQAPVHVAVPGSVFGEFVLFETEARTASARAVKPVAIFAIGARELRGVFSEDPATGYRVMDNLCQILVGRIRKTTKELKASLIW